MFKIIDPAVPPVIRIKPKRKQIVVIGTVIGAFLALLIAFFRENIKISEIIEKISEITE